MGFSENGCRRACVATGNTSVESAMEWVMGHMEDDDFNEPLAGGGGKHALPHPTPIFAR